MALTRPALAAVALLAFAAPPAAPAAPAPTTAQIVLYKGAVANPPAQTRKREQQLGFQARLRYRHAVGGFAARLTARQVDELRSDPAVAAVVPDLPVSVEGNPVAPGETVPPGLRRVGALQADDMARGASTAAVAVIDTGVDLANADLNVADGTNCVDPGEPAMDDHGHGTHVAGTIAARNVGSGVVGIAPGTKVYAVKVLGADGKGTMSSVICGIDWVAANADALGIKVANMSLGGAGTAGTCANQPEHAAVCALVAAGVSVVVAAGNEGASIASYVPAAYPEALTVTSMADTDGLPGGLGATCDVADDSALASSNWAATAADAAHTIAAPGGCVVSTRLGGGTVSMTGTSMATPHVAGAAALCLGEGGQAGPCAGMSPAEISATLRATAEGAATQANGFSGDPLHPVAGRYYGYLLHASLAPRGLTGAATAVGDHGVTLGGTVEASGGHATWWFELGTSAGNYDVTTTPDSGDDPSTVEQDATGLDSGTTYHYRLVVQADGWTVHGEDATFTTTGSPPPPPPDTAIDSGPAGLVTTDAVEVRFSGSPVALASSFECRLDGGSWTTCSSPYSAAGLSDGRHTFDVRALNSAGKRDLTPASIAWTVDRTPPDTQISGHPFDPTTSTSASFGLSSEAGATFTCRLDGEEWAACGRTVQRTGLLPGTHRFEARATDAAGLTDPTPALFEWTIISTAAPTPPPVGEPPAPFVSPVPLVSPPRPSTLERVGALKLDRRHGVVTVALQCRGGDTRCIGRLELRRHGRRVASRVVRVAANKSARLTFRLRGSMRGVRVLVTSARSTARL